MCHGTAGKSASGRTRRVLALSGAALTAGAAVAGFLANVSHFQRAEMATKIPQPAQERSDEGDILERSRGFMCSPVTDVRVLQENKGEMRTKMEMLIMETQAEFCKALEEVDGGTFKVDKWQRKEGEEDSVWAHLAMAKLNLTQDIKQVTTFSTVFVCVCVFVGQEAEESAV